MHGLFSGYLVTLKVKLKCKGEKLRHFTILFASLVVVACLLGTVDQGIACEPLPCQPGYLFPSEGTIPENGPPILWVPKRGGEWPQQPPLAKKPHVLLELNGKVVATQVEPLTGSGSYWVRAKSLWKQGERYQLQADNRCLIWANSTKLKAAFSIAPPAPAPTKLGKLIALPPTSGPLKVGTASGSCSVEAHAVWVDVNLTLDPSATPWEAIIEYETLVDGKKWLPSDSIGTSPIPGSSWVGHGRDRIYLLCDPKSHGFEGVFEGEHEIIMQGRISGQQEWLKSDPIKVVLRCDERGLGA